MKIVSWHFKKLSYKKLLSTLSVFFSGEQGLPGPNGDRGVPGVKGKCLTLQHSIISKLGIRRNSINSSDASIFELNCIKSY